MKTYIISAYYEHLRHFRELIIKEITEKGRQPQRLAVSFKPVITLKRVKCE
jgi:hypothetical protein